MEAISRRLHWQNGLQRIVDALAFDEPTRVMSVPDRYTKLSYFAEQDVAVIIISSEMTDHRDADRAIVMRQGRVAGEVDKSEMTENG